MDTNNSNLSNISTAIWSPPSAVPSLIAQIEFWVQLIIFYGLVGGIMSSVGNIAMVIGIIRTKKLRNRFFVILSYLSVVRTVLSIEQLTLFIQRTLRTLGFINVNIKRISCYFINFHLYYCTTLEMVLLLGLVIDRAVAIVAFKYYRNLKYQQAIVHCAIASAVTVLFKLIPSLFGVDWTETIACLSGGSPIAPIFRIYHANLDFTLTLVILSIYVGLILHVRFRFIPREEGRIRQDGDQEGMIAYKRQIKLLGTMRRLVLIHCGFTVAAKVLTSVSSLVPQDPTLVARLLGYSGTETNMDLFANVVMLLVTNKDLRKASFPCGNNQVNQASTTAPQQSNRSERTAVQARHR